MSSIPSAPTSVQKLFARSWMACVLANLDRWWMAYLTWRVEQAAIRQLAAMSDYTLEDIGITRGEIEHAVRGEISRERASPRYCIPVQKARRP